MFCRRDFRNVYVEMLILLRFGEYNKRIFFLLQQNYYNVLLYYRY